MGALGVRNKEEGRSKKDRGKETQTTIGIHGTLNINRESGGGSRRFIQVFVHGGKSFAVCQRF